MLVYNIILILALFSSVMACLFLRYDRVMIGNISVNSLKKIVFIFIFIILTAVSALRGETVGTDMINYIPRYMIISHSNWNDLILLSYDLDFEIGFVLFCKAISILNPNNTQVFIIITSMIVSFGFYKFISKYSVIPFLSLFIFITYGYWINSFNIIRQSLAISILIWGISLWQEDKKILSFLMSILAISFHISSLIFLFICFFKKIKFSDFIFVISLFIIVGLFIMPRSLLVMLISLTPFGWYADRTGSGEHTFIVLLLIFLVTYILKIKISRFDKNIDLWLWMLSFALMANVLAFDIGLFERVMKFFLVCLLIIIPDLCYIYRKKFINFLFCFCVLIAFSCYFYLILMVSPESSSNTFPYYSIYSLG